MELAARLASTVRNKSHALRASQVGLLDWFKKYLSHYIDKEFSPFHTSLCAELDEFRTKRKQKKVIIVPRGYAKSTFGSLAYPLKAICEGSERYILLVADNGDLANKYLAHIKSELEGNDLIKRDYPQACEGEVWTSDKIETNSGVCVESLGKGKNARGRRYKQYRPTLVVLDDPQNDEDVASATMREKDYEWFNRSLLPAGDTGTNFLVIGNNIHSDSLVGKLSTRQDFKTIKFASIMQWPEYKDGFWKKWEELYVAGNNIAAELFYAANKTYMDAGAEVLWKEKESLLDLMKMRADLGHSAFEAEKQNNPRDPSKNTFPESWLDSQREEIWYDSIPIGERLINVAYCDPAKGSDSKKGDDSAVIYLRYSPRLRRAFVEVDASRRPPSKLIDDIIVADSIIGLDLLAFETNGFQQLIKDEFVAKCNRPINVVGMENYNVSKVTRIDRLAVWLERGFFVFKRNCKQTRKLIQQLLDHPRSTKDDCSDSLEGAIRALTSYIGLDNTQNIGPHASASEPIMQHDGLGEYLIYD
jgi:hypothetical protein